MQFLTFILTISLLASLQGCSGVKFHTNLTGDKLKRQVSSHVARNDLQQFYSDQEAHESGANLLGAVKGEVCSGDGHRLNKKISYDRLKSLAIDSLKNNVIRQTGNGFTINSCQETFYSYCDKAVTCYGQAYAIGR